MKTHTITTYTIDDHPDKESVLQWIRDNWHDLGEDVLYECISSLKEFSKFYDLNLDYSIGIVSDRGEYIRAKIEDDERHDLTGDDLIHYLNLMGKYSGKDTYSGNCPFTGVCYDENLLDEIRVFLLKPDDRTFQELINDCTSKLLNDLHKEGEYIYSDEALTELLQCNQYDFNIDGSIY